MKREIRYKYMPKNEKKEVRTKFKSTKYGKSRMNTLRRLNFEGILCIVVGILYFVYAIGFSKLVFDYAVGGVLVIVGIVFTIVQVFVRYKEYDMFIAENLKRKKRK